MSKDPMRVLSGLKSRVSRLYNDSRHALSQAEPDLPKLRKLHAQLDDAFNNYFDHLNLCLPGLDDAKQVELRASYVNLTVDIEEIIQEMSNLISSEPNYSGSPRNAKKSDHVLSSVHKFEEANTHKLSHPEPPPPGGSFHGHGVQFTPSSAHYEPANTSEQYVEIDSWEYEATNHRSRSVGASPLLPLDSALRQVAPNAQVQFDPPRQVRSDLPPPPSDTNDDVTMQNLFRDLVVSNQKIMNSVERSFRAQHSLAQLPIRYYDGSEGSSFVAFSRYIEHHVEPILVSSGDRLEYLISCCQGRAYNAVFRFQHMQDQTKAYYLAKVALKEYFGQEYMIVDSCLKPLISGTLVKDDMNSIRDLVIEMNNCLQCLSDYGYTSELNSRNTLTAIQQRLPYRMQGEWVKEAGRTYERGYRPDFQSMVQFLERQLRLKNNPFGATFLASSARKGNASSSGQTPTAGNSSSMTSQPKKHTFAAEFSPESSSQTEPASSNNSISKSKRPISCADCNLTHYLNQCPNFIAKSVPEREKFCQAKNLCLNCLKPGHSNNSCHRGSFCHVTGCTTKHAALLHNEKPATVVTMPPKSEIIPQASISVTLVNESHFLSNVFLASLQVEVQGANGNWFKIHMLLDTCSSQTLMTQGLKDKLSLLSTPQVCSITGLTNQNVPVAGELISHVNCRSSFPFLRSSDDVLLENVFVVQDIPISRSCIFTSQHAQSYSHLKDLPLAAGDSDIELLVGTDSTSAFWHLDSRKGSKKEPYAVRTPLGWHVIGANGERSQFHNFSPSQVLATHVVLQREPTASQLFDGLYADFADASVFSSKPAPSIDDKKALSIVEESCVLEDTNQYSVSLPFKYDPSLIPSHKDEAYRRAKIMGHKLSKPGNESLYEDYCNFFDKHLSKGHIRKVEDPEGNPGKCYLPHHIVTNPHKPSRVVLDPSKSLNLYLYEGPDYINSLIGVLMRFRRYPIALLADIEGMYMNVLLKENEKAYVRLFWYPNNDLSQELIEFEAETHVWGILSSGFIANYCLRKAASFDDVSPAAISAILHQFYVDDMLNSFKTASDATELADELIPLLAKVGYHLHKLISNDPNVMSHFDKSEWSPSLVDLDFEKDRILTRTLGVKYDVGNDLFYFSVECGFPDGCTRRTVLSTVASVYDPLGIIAPIMLVVKLMLQRLCKDKSLDWDDEIPAEEKLLFQKWFEALPALNDFTTPRCYTPPGFDIDNISVIDLHGFADSSRDGYACTVFLRQIDVHNHVATSLVIGKSRVTPMKPKCQSIARGELTSTAVLVDLMNLVSEQIQLPITNKFYHSDSQSVLSCLYASTDKRFDVFWDNRISKILIHSLANQWRYIPTDLNSSDIGTRPVFANELDKLKFWVSGPPFLRETDTSLWPAQPEFTNVPEFCLLNLHTPLSESFGFSKFVRYFSCLKRLKRRVVWLTRFKNYLRSKVVDKSDISVGELESAENDIMRFVQYESGFSKNGDASYSLRKGSLKAFMHSDHLVRIGGRIHNSADMSFNAKHPVILPYNHPVTSLVIRFYHAESAHQGPKHVISDMLAKYWVTRAKATVRRLIQACPRCIRETARPLTQLMAPLPTERVSISFPFEHCGVDYFGPFYIVQGRRRVKRWICIFVCCTCRAVHLEFANDMTTDCFLCCFSRFMARRGRPATVFSGNDSNFIGSGNDAIEIDFTKVKRYASERSIVWHLHPPKASEHAGHYERLIRSVRRALSSLARDAGEYSDLHEDNFHTFVAEAEKVLNDRPLTHFSDNVNDERPLTPNMILLLRQNPASVPFELSQGDSRKHYLRSQEFADMFWHRWIREYVPTLQERQKNLSPVRNLKVNDLVLMADEKSPRANWPLGRVVEATPDDDGFVRSVSVQDKNGIKRRPINKLALLEGIQ